VAIRPLEDTWQRKAACRGPESVLFFPPAVPESRTERDAREARAKRICDACDVRDECLEYSLRIREPHGIWGGLNETERRLMLAPDVEA
jgi:WhiB family transcriptional regulator, redox-sensing transcriptional regulator